MHWFSYCTLNLGATKDYFKCAADQSYYRPQRSWGKVMFSQACVILFTGGLSVSVHAGIPHPPKQTPPPCRACWEIRSTRGRYASYWNTILYLFVFICNLRYILELFEGRIIVSRSFQSHLDPVSPRDLMT